MSRKLVFLSLIAALVALPTSGALGAIMAVATPVANPPGTAFTAPDAALGAPWRSYQLSLQATAGELIGAVDVTINGPLHQRWQDADFDGTTDPTPTGAPSNGRGDSHLTAPAGSPFGLAASETNSKTGSPLASDPGTREYGMGGLRGAWAILAPAATTNIAYIVVPGDQLPQIDVSVLTAGTGGDPLGTFDEMSFGLVGGTPMPMITDATIGPVATETANPITHTFQADQAIQTWNLVSFLGPGGAQAANAPTFSNGVFSWSPTHANLLGQDAASWIATVSGMNANGTDQGTLTINLVIPEPATMSLVGLAMIGLVGLVRRRS